MDKKELFKKITMTAGILSAVGTILTGLISLAKALYPDDFTTTTNTNNNKGS